VLRRLRRPTAALAATTLLAVPLLAACGSDDDSGSDSTSSKTSSSASPSESGSAGADDATAAAVGTLDEVDFAGDVGKELTATWKSAVTAGDSVDVTTLVEGDGDPIAQGDTVSAYLYLGDGTTQKDAYSDYTNGSPESIPYDDQLSELFSSMLKGQSYGARVAAVTSASTLFGESGSSQLGIGADDSLVVVADLVEKAAVAPTPTDDKAHDADPSTQPKVVEKDGKPTGLDFSGVKEPELDTPVQRVVLKEGDGAEVKSTDTVTVNYLGATYDADKPFDESFSSQPLTSALSGLIQGWSIGLTGVKVGSRVLLQIPPAYGYGAQGSGANIPGNATLWFVIDVQSVK
jgi:peptidylprolyl isomerase